MSVTVKERHSKDGVATPFSKAARTRQPVKRRSSISPVTLRLTPDERRRLEELADGMTLSAYIRACVFAKEERRRKRRPKSAIEDKKAIAEALALLGQSRIASNLNQLAYHANIGVLIVGDYEKAQIAEQLKTLMSSAFGAKYRSAIVKLETLRAALEKELGFVEQRLEEAPCPG